MKKLFSAFSVIFLLILVHALFLMARSDGRKGPEDYWKSVMADQAMPKAIKGMLKKSENSGAVSSARNRIRDHINKKFDTKTISIIYHAAVDHKG